MAKNSKKTIRNLSLAACASLACLVGLSYMPEMSQASIFGAQEETEKQQQNFANLTGFQPETRVSYQVYASGKTYTGYATTDDKGNLTLPMTDMKILGENVEYNFLIDEDGQAINIILVHDPETGNVSVKGSGTKKFTKVVIEADKRKFETQSDWAGIFEEENISDILADKENPKSYKIAFFSTDPSRAIHELTRSPIIEINTAPGGGGPDSNGVNVKQDSDCGEPLFSWCYSNMNPDGAIMQGIIANFIHPMQLFAEQLTFNAQHQALIIGKFLDAKEQLETQRDFQERVARAHKDYHPSEELCKYGSYSRSISHSDFRRDAQVFAFTEVMTDYMTNKRNGASSGGKALSSDLKLTQFREKFCDPSDHNNGLMFLCEHDQDEDLGNSQLRAPPEGGIGAEDNMRVNSDIDFFATIMKPYTIDVDFYNPGMTDREEEIIALAKNLYWPENFSYAAPETLKSGDYFYLDSRYVVALSNLAQNSFANIIAMKAASPFEVEMPGWAFMRTAMLDFPLDDRKESDTLNLYGHPNPSYNAQMDFLTNRIYQNPDFYVHLYDKPANVDRLEAVLDAISLMQTRDFYESALRSEMVASGMVQTEILPAIERINASIITVKQ